MLLRYAINEILIILLVLVVRWSVGSLTLSLTQR